MSKTNFIVKHLKNINNFINNLLEKNLNKLNFKNLSFLLKNNKIILTFVALFVIFVSYLLLPTFFNQTDILKKLKNEVQVKYDLNFKFSQNIKYNFFPKPHFLITDSKILNNEKEISKISKLKIFISFDDLFSLKNIEVRDLIFENANFHLNTKNYNFFVELLNRSFQGGDIIINNSNVFFKHLEDEVLFITKIFKMKYYFDTKELKNIFYSENEIFNIPFSVESFFSEDKKKNLSTINFNLIKLSIENELIFENDAKVGTSKFYFNKIYLIFIYLIKLINQKLLIKENLILNLFLEI